MFEYNSFKTLIGKRGILVIPVAIRQLLDIQEGEMVELRIIDGDEISIKLVKGCEHE